jgi:hypothetical protein
MSAWEKAYEITSRLIRLKRNPTRADERQVNDYLAQVRRLSNQIMRFEQPGRLARLLQERVAAAGRQMQKQPRQARGPVYPRSSRFHEAGHALVAVMRGWSLEGVYVSDDGSGGCRIIDKHSDPAVCLAGVAGMRSAGFSEKDAWVGANDDRERALHFACAEAGSPIREERAVIDRALREASTICSEQHRALFALADALSRTPALSGTQVERIIDANSDPHTRSWRCLEHTRRSRAAKSRQAVAA